MLNKSKKELQTMSTYSLQERLDCLCDMKVRMYNYRDVFNTSIINGKLQEVEPLTSMMQDEINLIIDILEFRNS